MIRVRFPRAGFGGFGRYAGLRDELLIRSAAPESAGRDYDRILADAGFRKELVKVFQTWAKARGTYSKRIDGEWGDGSEGAFLQVAPATGRLTSFEDLGLLYNAMRGHTDDASRGYVALGVGIARNLWLEARGLTSPHVDPRQEPEEPEVTSSLGPEDVVTVVPVTQPDGTADQPEDEIEPVEAGGWTNGDVEEMRITVHGTKPTNWPLIIGVSVGGVVLLTAGALVARHLLRKKRRK